MFVFLSFKLRFNTFFHHIQQLCQCWIVGFLKRYHDSSLCFNRLIVEHEIVWSFHPFNVNLQWVQHIYWVKRTIFWEKLDCVLLEEIMNRRICNIRLIGCPVCQKTTLCICQGVMGSCNYIFWKILDSIYQVSIFRLQNNTWSWGNRTINSVAIPALFLTFFKIWIVYLN